MMRLARAAAFSATVVVASGAAVACGGSSPDDSPFNRPQHSASYQGDSTRVVALAIRALGDSLPMRVEAITRGAQGWQVRLLPVRGGTAGGGMVWVEINDSSATVVKRY